MYIIRIHHYSINHILILYIYYILIDNYRIFPKKDSKIFIRLELQNFNMIHNFPHIPKTIFKSIKSLSKILINSHCKKTQIVLNRKYLCNLVLNKIYVLNYIY